MKRTIHMLLIAVLVTTFALNGSLVTDHLIFSAAEIINVRDHEIGRASCRERV